MRFHGIALTLLAVCSSLFAKTAALASVSIRLDAPGGSMEHIRQTSQDGIGDCYAHVGTAMAEAWKFSRYQSDDPADYPAVSVVEAAVTAVMNNSLLKTHSSRMFLKILTHQKRTIEGGDTCDVVDSLIEHGGCSVSDEPDLDPKTGDLKAIKRRFDDACQKNRILFPKGRCISFSAPAGAYEGIFDKLLARKHAQPIGLGIDEYVLMLGRDYNSSRYRSSRSRADYPRFIHHIPIFSKPIDDLVGYSRGHAVLLLGKRVKNERSQYLLRNMTPLGDTSADWDWEDYYYDVWVDADILVQAVLNASIIQRR